MDSTDLDEAIAKVEKILMAISWKLWKTSSRIVSKCFLFNKAEVAQLVEQPIRNRQVPGSSPGLGSIQPSAREAVARL